MDLLTKYTAELRKRIIDLRDELKTAAHPRKTRQSVFLEQYPQADIDNTGLLILCPKRISVDIRVTADCMRQRCSDCRREFWMQEVE